jgi:hypothetical protein
MMKVTLLGIEEHFLRSLTRFRITGIAFFNGVWEICNGKLYPDRKAVLKYYCFIMTLKTQAEVLFLMSTFYEQNTINIVMVPLKLHFLEGLNVSVLLYINEYPCSFSWLNDFQITGLRSEHIFIWCCPKVNAVTAVMWSVHEGPLCREEEVVIYVLVICRGTQERNKLPFWLLLRRWICEKKKLTVVGLACNNCSFLNFMHYKTHIFGGM